MVGQKRRKYTLGFKQEAVRLVREQDMSPAEVGRDLGVDRSVKRSWVVEAEAGELTSAPACASRKDVSEGGDLDLEAEFRRLRRESAILREEREILKKRRPSSPFSSTSIAGWPSAGLSRTTWKRVSASRRSAGRRPSVRGTRRSPV